MYFFVDKKNDTRIDIIKETLSFCTKRPLIIAIDGRCAAGKSTLAQMFEQSCNANIFKMDDFFLPLELRTKERFSKPGENVHYERFRTEVLEKILTGKNFSYKPFDCSTLSYKESVKVFPKEINIVEGSYSCRPDLISFYDVCIFIDVNKQIQQERIQKRNGQKATMFFEKWIPLEEEYFSFFNIKEKADFVLTSK